MPVPKAYVADLPPIDAATAVDALKKLRETRASLLPAIRRKRAIRESERTMGLADVKREVAALDLALEHLQAKAAFDLVDKKTC